MRTTKDERPTGQIGGSDLPDRGTGTAVGDTYGADIGQSSTNRMGPMTGTGSDPAMQDKAHDTIKVDTNA